MNLDKKVSIVLPVYNGEDNLSEAIESILRQTYKNIELIIVNDCSTDGSKAIAEAFMAKDNRIKIVDNVRNLKLPNSLNAGFNEATGDYFTWTSDDNILKDNNIEVLVDSLSKSDDAVMVYSDYSTIDEDGKIIEEIKKENASFLKYSNVVGASFLYRATAAKAVGGYDANLFLAEDYDYWIRLSKIGRILHIEDDLYLYRLHGGSLTATRQDAIGKQTYKVIEKHFIFLYSQVSGIKQRIFFFDHMMKWLKNSDEELRKHAIKDIANIFPTYKFILFFRSFFKR